MRLLWHWSTMGPYHFARMDAVGRVPGIELRVVETTLADDHAWRREERPEAFNLVTLSKQPLSATVYRETAAAFQKSLSDWKPDTIVASGYAEPWSRWVARGYCAKNRGALRLFWCESAVFDRRRNFLQEAVKRKILQWFDGCLVAGSPHRGYMARLGMPAERIGIVGNVVDNTYFQAGSARARQNATAPEGLKPGYFLFVGRLLPVKNVDGLLRAYASYRSGISEALARELVIVGDGPERERLIRMGAEARFGGGVRFLGGRQIEELPALYAHALCLVLPSTSEPWGLVVNEAMASGVPAIVSSRCGCADDLVEDGRTGFVFPAEKSGNGQGEKKLSRLMAELGAASDGKLEKLRTRAAEKVAEFAVPVYASKVDREIRRLRELPLRRSEPALLPVMNAVQRMLMEVRVS